MYFLVGPRATFACLLFCLPVYSKSSSFSGYDIFTSGVPLEVDPIINPNTVCKNTPSLTNEQLELCKVYPDVVASALQGTRIAIHECQHQLTYKRWNCSSMESKNSNPLTSGLFVRGFRETAFVHAIISAGMTQAIGKSCSMGKLASCGCDNSVVGEGRGWSWGGCSDNTAYGVKLAAKFLDSREKGADMKSLMNLHNNRAGRLAVLDNMKTKCKCVGVSGSCSLKTCWKTVPEFREVGTILKEKYDYAIMIHVSNRNRGKIRPLHRKSAKANDFQRSLVFFEPSPNYCEKEYSMDIPGTKGRVCKVDSLGTDNCELLCCARGYDTLRMTITKRCRCHFNWCCYVLCDKCVENAWVTVCK